MDEAVHKWCWCAHGLPGEVSSAAKKLCETTHKALHDAIKICAEGTPYNRIGKVWASSVILAWQSRRNCLRQSLGTRCVMLAGAALAILVAEAFLGLPWLFVLQVIHKIADEHKYGVVKDFVGHGVGTVFHSDPHIQHTRNNDSRPMKLWQTFTIEPMLVEVRRGVCVAFVAAM